MIEEIVTINKIDSKDFKKISYDGRRFYLALDDKGKIIVRGVLRYKDTFIMVYSTSKIFYGTEVEIAKYIEVNNIDVKDIAEISEIEDFEVIKK